MIEKLKWAGWIIATCLSLILLVQRSYRKNNLKAQIPAHDTIVIHGDSQLYMVRDTITVPYKIYYRDNILKIDSAQIIKDYFASRVYHDTIKARDITAVIEDSISLNKVEGHKVLLENSRDLHLTTDEPKATNKLFAGGFIGYSSKNILPVAGISLSFETRNDLQFCYGYDVINRYHTVGLSWKIHFQKK